MNKVLPLIIFSILIATITSPVQAGVPGLITFEFEIEVDFIEDDGGLLVGILEVGDTLTGTYTFDPDTPDLAPLIPSLSNYAFDSLNVQFDSVVYQTVPPFVLGCNVINIDNTIDVDEYLLQSFCGLKQQSGTPLTDDAIFNFQLDDFDGTVFSDTSLPLTPPDLAEFEVNNSRLKLLDEFDAVEVVDIFGHVILLQLQPPQSTVGGELIPLDTTALLLAGVQANALWLIPIVIAAVGIGIVIARKF